MTRAPCVTLWAGSWGDFVLPDDFPSSLLRVDGWFDKRFGIYPKFREYIEEQDGKLRDDLEKSGFRALSFTVWMQCGSVPNRLLGVTINHEGDAV